MKKLLRIGEASQILGVSASISFAGRLYGLIANKIKKAIKELKDE